MSKEPYELYPEIWKSKSAFFTYIRGHLRQIWSRFPPKLEWKKAQSFPPPKGYTGRAKRLCKCYYCKQDFPVSSTEVDHAEMAGTCNSWETATQFLYNLLNCNSEWRITCKPCHKVKSLAERRGTSFEQAVLDKQVIALMKESKQKQLAFIQQAGYNTETLTNAGKRKEAITTILQEQMNVKRRMGV